MQRSKKLIVLADMITVDEEALICDLAETYHIYDYKSLPLSRVAIFAVGLRADSRIKMKMNNMRYPFETILMAAGVDRLTNLLWMKSKDGASGINKPKSILSQLLNEEMESDIEAFSTPEDFEKRRNEILQKGGI